MLDRDARALLDLIDERGLPAMHTLAPAEWRAKIAAEHLLPTG